MKPLLEGVDLGRGVIASQNPLALPFGYLEDGRNVLWENGRLKKRLGFTVIKSAGLPYHARFCRFFRNASGTACLIAATKEKLYKYTAGTNTFDALIAASGTFSSTVDNDYYDADVWGGTLYLVKRGGDAWSWNGAAATATDVSAGITTGPTYLRAFNSRLVGAHCYFGATSYPQSVYWSAPDLPEDWAGAGSGNETRRSLRGDIMGLETVARGLALFAEESIEMIGEGPDAAAPFTFEPVEPTLGTPSPHSIAKLGPPFSGQAAFLGSDLNLHVLNGLRAIPVGDDVHPILKALIERDYLTKAWARVDPEEGVYRLALPTAGSSENNLILEWWFRRGAFYLHEFSGTDKAWTCASRWTKASPLTYTQQSATGLTFTQQLATGKTYAEMLKSTGKREVAFLGSTGHFVGPFEGLNDNTTAIDAWATFHPNNLGSDGVKETAYVEVLDDRLGSANTLSLLLGRSMDSASYSWDSRDHTLGETTDPFVEFRNQGRWFKLKVANGETSQSFAIRGFRVYGEVVGEER